ncbi:hypothetical protein QM565_27535 [Geitlerinema splendidum]|nr:hypothetical protein [Geitlerinema splendidum]
MTGSGKSTLAQEVSRATGLPLILVDELMWLPNWQEVALEEQRSIITPILEGDRWVLDTAYGKWCDLAFSRAELVVFLDYPRWLSFVRLLKRTFLRATLRTPCCNGNVESWKKALSRDSILIWHVRSFSSKRRRMDALKNEQGAPCVLFHRSPRETAAWLMGLRDAGG